VIGSDRTSIRYAPKRGGDDEDLRDRLKALARERRRFGHRRLHGLLRREGYEVNRKRVQRIYREEKLMVRKLAGGKGRWEHGAPSRRRCGRTSGGASTSCQTSSPWPENGVKLKSTSDSRFGWMKDGGHVNSKFRLHRDQVLA